jgi:nicotinate-nucleotide adenylyltransferase
MAGPERVNPPRLGLMCGTFDPPHLGHLLLAELAWGQLGLARVLFLPVGQPTHKTAVTTAVHRLALTHAAIADNPHFAVDETDMARPAPHYTATLLPLIQAQYPDHELWLLLGEDAWQDLPRWYQPDQIRAQARLAVLPRPGAGRDDGAGADEVGEPPRWLQGPALSVSSTWLRRELAGGRVPRYLLPTAVINYIHTHQLYRRPQPSYALA